MRIIACVIIGIILLFFVGICMCLMIGFTAKTGQEHLSITDYGELELEHLSITAKPFLQYVMKKTASK
jgi:hypothetical protein